MIHTSIPKFLLNKNESIIHIQNQIYLAELRGNVQLVKKLYRILLKHPILRFQILNLNLLHLKKGLAKETTISHSSSSNFDKNLPQSFNPSFSSKFSKNKSKDLLPLTEKFNHFNFTSFQEIEMKISNRSCAREIINSFQEKIEAQLSLKFLEPIWESRFTPISYGDRPGRCCYDAILKIRQSLAHETAYFYKVNLELGVASPTIKSKPEDNNYLNNFLFSSKSLSFNQKLSAKVFLNTKAQIKLNSVLFKPNKNFHTSILSLKKMDSILESLLKGHNTHLAKLTDFFPNFSTNIRFEMLESELIGASLLLNHHYFFKSTMIEQKNEPQKDALQPFKSEFSSNKESNKTIELKQVDKLKLTRNLFEFKPFIKENKFLIIRSSTDFLILNSNLEQLNEFSLLLEKLFQQMPYFSIKKTEIGHTLLPLKKINAGLTFLNFEISQIQQIKKTALNEIPLNAIGLEKRLLTRISPSSFALKEHIFELKSIVKNLSSQTQEKLIFKLTPKIRFWSQYFRISTTKKDYFLCDFFLLKILWRWACRRHSKKSRQWIREKYFHRIQQKNWQFAVFQKETNSFLCLPHHSETSLIFYQKIDEEDSPYLLS